VPTNYCCTTGGLQHLGRQRERERERVGMVVKRRKESKEALEKKSTLGALLETY
jgi:hypothetical protein